jgi:hypothetical protein
VFSLARALENVLPHLYVNQVGCGEGFTFAGGTFAVSVDGNPLADAGSAGEEVLDLELELPARNSIRPYYLGRYARSSRLSSMGTSGSRTKDQETASFPVGPDATAGLRRCVTGSEPARTKG